jgi:tetratricopeptide (TPR) repeat protein
LYTADANALLGDISKRRPLDKATGDYYQQASVLYREVGVIRPLASLNNSLGWHHFYNAPEKAMGHFQEAYAGHSRIGNILGMATSSGSMALLQFDRGEPDEAAARLKDSLAYYEKGGYLAGASAAAHNLGTIYYQLGRYETALTYFDRSLEIKRQLGTLMELFLTIGSVGVVKIEVGDYGEARRQLEEALHFFEESGPESELLVVLWELARLAARTGHFSEAEANLERVRQLARGGENPNWRALPISTALLARLYHYRGQEAQALTYFEEAKEYFEHYRQPFDEARFLLLPKAALWVGQNKLEAAQGLIEQIRPLQAGDSAIVLNSMLLEVRIAHAGGRMEDARAILASLVPHPERPSDPALIQYELFHLKRNRQEAELALSLFKNLTAKTPDISYQEQLQELELFLETAD